jgi:hypothetical protein
MPQICETNNKQAAKWKMYVSTNILAWIRRKDGPTEQLPLESTFLQPSGRRETQRPAIKWTDPKHLASERDLNS